MALHEVYGPANDHITIGAFLDAAPEIVLTPELELTLYQQMQDPDQEVRTNARNMLVNQVRKLAFSYANLYFGKGVPIWDLIQSVNKIIIEITPNFDPNKGGYTTYIINNLRGPMQDVVAKQGEIIPKTKWGNQNIYETDRLIDDFIQTHQRPPTRKELFELSGRGKREFDGIMRDMGRTFESLDNISNGDSDQDPLEVLAGISLDTIQETVFRSLLKEELQELIFNLSPKEAKVLTLRFGLQNQEPHSLEQIGEKFGLTRERIRQIEAKALKKLRHPTRSKRLRPYLDY